MAGNHQPSWQEYCQVLTWEHAVPRSTCQRSHFHPWMIRRPNHWETMGWCQSTLATEVLRVFRGRQSKVSIVQTGILLEVLFRKECSHFWFKIVVFRILSHFHAMTRLRDKLQPIWGKSYMQWSRPMEPAILPSIHAAFCHFQSQQLVSLCAIITWTQNT